MNKKGNLFIIAAPSGAGKTSLVKALLAERQAIQVSVSHTTRRQRVGEVEGVNYHFVDVATFEQMIADQAFLEHAQVYENYYGTSRDWVKQRLQAGIDVILEIDWQGAAQIRQVYADCITIFILPPSRQALHDRLTARGQDAISVIDARMRQATEEISHYCEFDYLVINDNFEQALIDLTAIIHASGLSFQHQERQQEALLKQLLG